MKFKLVLLLSLFQLMIQCVYSGDTLKITEPELELKFRQNNLTLLSLSKQIEASKGNVEQAKLWDNPYITLEQSANNKISNRFFDYSKTKGVYSLSINQSVPLFGRIGARSEFEESNSRIAELNYFSNERSLLALLKSSYYNIYFLDMEIKLYEENIDTLNKIISSSDEMFSKGIIAYQDVLRLKSMLLNLETEKEKIESEVSKNQVTLAGLISEKSVTYFVPDVITNLTEKIKINDKSIEECIGIALDNSLDIKLEDELLRSYELNLALQKKTAYPDINVGALYESAGNAYPGYLGLQLGMAFPLINRNQGYIMYAENLVAAERITRQKLIEQVKNDVIQYYRIAMNKQLLLSKFSEQYGKNLMKYLGGLVENYRKRNISTIEFSDYFQSYFTSMVQYISLQGEFIDSVVELNYVMCKDLYNIN